MSVYRCITITLFSVGARCSSVVRVFTHGAIGRLIDPSWSTHWTISHCSQCSTTGVIKAVYVLSCMYNDEYKRTLAATRKE